MAVVRPIDTAGSLWSGALLEDLEQELVDQYCLAALGAGLTDAHVADDRAVLLELIDYLPVAVWEMMPAHADGWLTWLRRQRRLARSTVQSKAWAVAQFFEFLLVRYQADIHAVTGHVVVQPIDEFNRPAKADYATAVRVPPETAEVDALFSAWRASLPGARKYLPAARDYLAASLWRRAGLRINETVGLDIRDWRPDLGAHGKLHIRFGKGSQGRGPKPRLVPGIDAVDELLDWWPGDVRHQYPDSGDDPDAALLPSERRDRDTGAVNRVGADALRSGLASAVAAWLPAWTSRLTPHALRHYCASSLYERGVDLKAIQELLGHEWLSTTTRSIHIHAEHIESAWADANQRVTTRLEKG